jgi:hypothetical protein
MALMRLDADIQSGPGEEIVRAARWSNAVYDVYVHNYSDDRSPTRQGVLVTVYHPRQHSPQQIEGSAFAGDRGRYWHVCAIDGTAGLVETVGTLSDRLS